MKVSGENVSAFIDRAIEYYDETFLPRQRGKDQWAVEEQVFRRNLAAVKRHVLGMYDAPELKSRAWEYQLRSWIALEEDEEE